MTERWRFYYQRLARWEVKFLIWLDRWCPLFRPKVVLTPAEMAGLILECLEELKAEGIERTDFALEALEQVERTEPDAHRYQHFQSIRAELYRAGVRHSEAQP
jgi:hypothetical protein